MDSRGKSQGGNRNFININIDEDEHDPPEPMPQSPVMLENNFKPSVNLQDDHQAAPLQQDTDQGTRHQEVAQTTPIDGGGVPVEMEPKGAVDGQRDEDEIRGAIRSIPANDDRSINKLISMLTNNERQAAAVLRYVDEQQQGRIQEQSNAVQTSRLNENNRLSSNDEGKEDKRVNSNDNEETLVEQVLRNLEQN